MDDDIFECTFFLPAAPLSSEQTHEHWQNEWMIILGSSSPAWFFFPHQDLKEKNIILKDRNSLIRRVHFPYYFTSFPTKFLKLKCHKTSLAIINASEIPGDKQHQNAKSPALEHCNKLMGQIFNISLNVGIWMKAKLMPPPADFRALELRKWRQALSVRIFLHE